MIMHFEIVLNILSLFISTFAVGVAMYSIWSSGKDAKKQLKKINLLIASTIDDTIAQLEAECNRLLSENTSISIRKKEWDSDFNHAFSSIHNFGKDKYESAIESNNRQIQALKSRIEDLKKRKALILGDE